ncbi:MAG: hypothetical protein CM15mP59_5780 [Flavobacteriaceae bacterium]|nr:MAG: hypothetical protein CM15mP59_5780 [Flavobacteriaceae bacterium]
MDKNYATGWNELKPKTHGCFQNQREFVEGVEKWDFTIPVYLFLDQPEHLNHADYQLARKLQREKSNWFWCHYGWRTWDYGSCKQGAQGGGAFCRTNN